MSLGFFDYIILGLILVSACDNTSLKLHQMEKKLDQCISQKVKA